MAREPKIDTVVCTKPRCGGLLFDVTSRLAESQGVLHRRRDRCGDRWAVRVAEPPAAPRPTPVGA